MDFKNRYLRATGVEVPFVKALTKFHKVIYYLSCDFTSKEIEKGSRA